MAGRISWGAAAKTSDLSLFLTRAVDFNPTPKAGEKPRYLTRYFLPNLHAQNQASILELASQVQSSFNTSKDPEKLELADKIFNMLVVKLRPSKEILSQMQGIQKTFRVRRIAEIPYELVLLEKARHYAHSLCEVAESYFLLMQRDERANEVRAKYGFETLGPGMDTTGDEFVEEVTKSTVGLAFYLRLLRGQTASSEGYHDLKAVAPEDVQSLRECIEDVPIESRPIIRALIDLSEAALAARAYPEKCAALTSVSAIVGASVGQNDSFFEKSFPALEGIKSAFSKTRHAAPSAGITMKPNDPSFRGFFRGVYKAGRSIAERRAELDASYAKLYQRYHTLQAHGEGPREVPIPYPSPEFRGMPPSPCLPTPSVFAGRPCGITHDIPFAGRLFDSSPKTAGVEKRREKKKELKEGKGKKTEPRPLAKKSPGAGSSPSSSSRSSLDSSAVSRDASSDSTMSLALSVSAAAAAASPAAATPMPGVSAASSSSSSSRSSLDSSAVSRDASSDSTMSLALSVSAASPAAAAPMPSVSAASSSSSSSRSSLDSSAVSRDASSDAITSLALGVSAAAAAASPAAAAAPAPSKKSPPPSRAGSSSSSSSSGRASSLFPPRSPIRGYDSRVLRWEEPAAVIQTDYASSGPLRQEAMVLRHAFTTDVDRFVGGSYSRLLAPNAARRFPAYNLLGEIEWVDSRGVKQKTRGCFEYGMEAEGICYHRFLRIKEKEADQEFVKQFIKGRSETDYPAIAKSYELYAARAKDIQMVTPDGEFRYILGPLGTIQFRDEPNDCTITLFNLG